MVLLECSVRVIYFFFYFSTASCVLLSSSKALNDYECGAESAMDEWLAEPSVVEALHVKAGTVGMTYQKTATDLLPLYRQLIEKYQMLIYSGDTDGCVPYVGTEAWTRGMNYSVVEDW
jgi:hypothetical protein